MSEMYIYGIHPVEELLRRSGSAVTEVVVAGDLSDNQFSEIAAEVRSAQIPVRRASDEELDRIADGGNHQRIAAGVSSFPYRHLGEVLTELPDDGHRCILALAQVQDPGNLGAILRSGAALDVDAVIIPKHRAAQMTPAVVRASAGMAFHLPLVQVTNLSRALRTLKDEGYWVVGTVADDAQPMWTMDWELNAAIVMGGEHQGMRPGVEKECDFRLTIPMTSGTESLNVAAATAITLYDRRRSLADSGNS